MYHSSGVTAAVAAITSDCLYSSRAENFILNIFNLTNSSSTSHAALLQRPIGATREQDIAAERGRHDAGRVIFEDLILFL